MRKGTVLILEKHEMVDSDDVMAFYTKDEVYEADLVMCDDKIIKNRWGKYGTIVEPDFEHPIDRDLRMRLLLDIFKEITKQKGASI
jgi:hypothetical protein